MFATTVLSPMAVAGLFFDPPLCKSKEERRRRSSMIFAFLSFSSMLLCSIGCGVAVWKYRTPTNEFIAEVSIWTTITNGTRTYNFDIDCYDLSSLWKAAGSFSIASAILSGCCVVIGMGRFFKLVSVIPAMVLGGVTSLTTLVTWAVLTHIWYTRFCNAMQTYEQSFFIRTPGYGFFVASFAAVLIGTLMVTYASIRNRTEKTTFPWQNVVLFLTTMSAVLFGLVAMPTVFFEITPVSGNSYQQIFLWYANVQAPDNTFTHWPNLSIFFNCDQLAELIKAVRYVQLVGVLFAGTALLFAFTIFRAPRLRVAVLIANYFACGLYGLALLLWIIALRSSNFCGGMVSISDQGYAVSSGAALQIIGFLFTLYGAFVPCAEAMLGSREPAP